MDFSTLLLTTLLLFVMMLIYYTTLKPFIAVMKIKIKFGKQAQLCFKPIVGISYILNKSLKDNGDTHAYLINVAKTQPHVKVILSNLLIWPYIIFMDHTYVKKILVDHDHYDKFRLIPETRLLYKGLFYTKGNKWRQQRKQLARSFTFESLRSRAPLMNQVVRDNIKGIQDGPFKALEILASVAGEILIKSFFGAEMENVQLNGKSLQLETTEIFGELGSLMKTNMYFLIGFKIFGQNIWKIYPGNKAKVLHQRVDALLDYTTKLIQTRLDSKRVFYEQAPKDSLVDFLDVFLYEYVHQKEDQITLTFEEIIQQFLTFFFAGTDTSAHTVSLMLYYLGKDQKGQEELREELANVSKDQDVTNDDLNNLPKLNAFLKECLRLKNPALSLIPRQASEDHFIKDVFIQKGWYVGNNQLAQMARSEYIDNASEFDWKRWLDKDPIKDVNDQAYVFTPFSAGGRNCIGQHLAQMEVKIIICHFLRTFKVTLNEQQTVQWSIKFLYSFGPETIVQLNRI